MIADDKRRQSRARAFNPFCTYQLGLENFCENGSNPNCHIKLSAMYIRTLIRTLFLIGWVTFFIYQ